MDVVSKLPVDRPSLKDRLRFYYAAEDPRAYRFRYAILAFDCVTLLFIVVSSFFQRNMALEVVDVAFGILILADFSARLYISRNRWRDIQHPATWADAVAILSFLIPMAGEGAAFLRVLRTLRLLQTYQILARLRADSQWFRRNEELTITLIHLVVFLFVMSGLVYDSTLDQSSIELPRCAVLHGHGADDNRFGDITLSGTAGDCSRSSSDFRRDVVPEVVRALLQPHKVRFPCPDCGLQRHDQDAVHCKACGRMLNIPMRM